MMYHVTIISCCMVIFLKLARLCPPRLGTKEERTASQCRAPNLKKSWRNSVPFGVSKTSEIINASFRDGRYGTHISSGIHLKCNAFSPSPPLAFQKTLCRVFSGQRHFALWKHLQLRQGLYRVAVGASTVAPAKGPWSSTYAVEILSRFVEHDGGN